MGTKLAADVTTNPQIVTTTAIVTAITIARITIADQMKTVKATAGAVPEGVAVAVMVAAVVITITIIITTAMDKTNR
jgi:hypothetical protein